MNKNEQRVPTVPALVTEAERFLRDDLQHYLGQVLDDGVEPKLCLHVQATVAAWRVRVQVGGRWKPVTLGRVGELGIEDARRHAAALRKHGCRFSSQELLDETLGRKSTPAGKEAASALSVMDCFLAGMKKLSEEGKLKPKTANRYQAALRACGKDFFDLSVGLAGPAEVRRAVTAFRRRYSGPYARNLKAALDIAFEHAIDQHEATGVARNPTISLRDIDYDVSDNPEPRQNLEWSQLRAFWWWLCDKRCPLTPTQIRLYQTMLLTGERIDTLARARWSQLGDDGWWVIPPHERKLRLMKPGQTPPLYIRMTELLWQILGEPGNGSPYIFPAENDPMQPYPQGSRPLFRLFRVREAVQRGVTIESLGRKVTVPAPLSGSRSKATAKRERWLLRHYGTFLVPPEVPEISHHEAGRHTVATLAQEECIPGLYVSWMLGHAIESSVDVPILHHSAYVRLATAPPPPMPRALLRQAAALATTGKTARQHYTTVRDVLRGIEAAWIFWTAAFCREVLGGHIPASLAAAQKALLGPDDQILAILQARFPSLETALQHVAAGHYVPTLHTVR